MSVHSLLSRLDRVRHTGDGRWIARCPAHEDRRPSLSLREVPDGRVLLYCFAGCSTTEVLEAIGATWADVCPPRDPRTPRRLRCEPFVFASDALRVLAHEARVLVICAGDLANGWALSATDHDRLLLAAERIAKAESVCLS